jgi:hypothetical protein
MADGVQKCRLAGELEVAVFVWRENLPLETSVMCIQLDLKVGDVSVVPIHAFCSLGNGFGKIEASGKEAMNCRTHHIRRQRREQ